MTPDYDLVVVGAGPAGLAAGLVAAGLRMRAVVLEAGVEAGGQLRLNPTPLLDVPGHDARSGPALAATLRSQLIARGGELLSGVEVTAVGAETGEVRLGGSRTLIGSAVLLATGAAPRRLGVPGEDPRPGRGLSPFARAFGPTVAGRPVVVVGGGDVACEEAALLARLGCPVHLICRGRSLRACPAFRAAALAAPGLTLHTETRLVAIEGDAAVESARVEGPDGPMRIDAAAVVICAGLAPRSGLVVGQCELDAEGAVRVDTRQRTSAGRLYAIGDVCAGSSWTVAAAWGQAAIAVKDVERRMARDELPTRPVTGWPFAPAPWERSPSGG